MGKVTIKNDNSNHSEVTLSAAKSFLVIMILTVAVSSILSTKARAEDIISDTANDTASEMAPIQYSYDCVSKESGGEYVKLIVNANGKKDLVIIDNEPADMDIKYASTVKNKTRYVYRKNSEGTNLIVIENSLRNGAPNGLMALQWRGDAFSQTIFSCTRD